MLTFETINELTLKVTCTGNDVLFTKAGSFIAGENPGGKNYKFEKLLLGPQGNIAQAALGSIMRRVTKENIPLMKVTMMGDSVTYYADYSQHVVIYKLAIGEIVSVESENILAFTQDCKYSVRFIGCGVVSQKGLATSTLTGTGNNAYVAILTNGNPIVLNNERSRDNICDPQIRADLSWKNFIGQASGESYYFEWSGSQPVSVVVQPSERRGGIQVSID